MEGIWLKLNIYYIVLTTCLAVNGYSISNSKKDLQENSLIKSNNQKFGETAIKQLGKFTPTKQHSIYKREIGFNKYSEILNALRKKEFIKAQEIFKKNNYDIPSLIQEMYATEEISFSTIFKFIVDNLSKTKSLIAYKTLSGILTKYEDSLNQSLQLKDNIQKYIIDDGDTNKTIQNKAYDVLNYLNDHIKSLVVEKLTNNIVKKKYTNNDQIEIVNKVYLKDINLFRIIMKNVVDNVYDKVSSDYLWLLLASQTYQQQANICFELLWDKMKGNGDSHVNVNTIDKLLNLYVVKERLKLDLSLPDIQTEVIDLFLDHLLHNEPSSKDVNIISKKICDFDNIIFENIIYTLIKNLNGRIEIFLKTFTTQKYYMHTIIAYMAAFNHMKSKGDLKIALTTVRPLLLMHDFFENLSSDKNIKKVKKGLMIKIENIKKQLPDIKREITDIIKNSVINGNYDSSEMMKLTNEICVFNMDICLSIVKNVIEDLYDRNNVERLIDYSKSQLYIEPEIVSITILFDKLSANSQFAFEFEIANALKNIMSYPDLISVRSELVQRLKQYKMKLNPSIRNAVFLDKVCIKNVESGKFLYASSGIYNKRRTVTTRTSRTDDAGIEWKILKANEFKTFRIKSLKYNEYMCASQKQWDQNGQVFTWTSGELLKESKWKMIPFDEGVILKAAHSNENIYIENNKEGKLHTAYASSLNERTTFVKWKIEECR